MSQTITEIYKKYKINKGLQEHMLRVASVGKLISEMKCKTSAENIVSACLLHDMGNLIKSKLDLFPELFEPEGVEYWSKVKGDMVAMYGSDVHNATLIMVKEIVSSEEITRIIDEMAFDRICSIANESNQELKIALYADMRVGLHGMITIDERFDDIRDRYVPQRFTNKELENRRKCAKKIEGEIFETIDLQPIDIHDESIKVVMEDLRTYKII